MVLILCLLARFSGTILYEWCLPHHLLNPRTLLTHVETEFPRRRLFAVTHCLLLVLTVWSRGRDAVCVCVYQGWDTKPSRQSEPSNLALWFFSYIAQPGLELAI